MNFREFVTLVKPRYVWYRHSDLLAGVLQDVADGKRTRVMVFMPPRHGKSEEVSRLFAAYYLTRYPDRWVGIASYAAALARTLSRGARDNFTAGGGIVRHGARSVSYWETEGGGGLWAAGVDGPITGLGFHLGIIDDPLKNSEDAASELIRGKQKEWYSSTFYTREEPGGAIIIIQTRWHEDDLSGYLLAAEGGDEDSEPERWNIVCLEALKESEPPHFPEGCPVEPDWRAPGEALCPERCSVERLRKVKRRMGSYFWAALYQQQPRPREGDMLQGRWFEPVDAVPVEAERVRYWDKAGTRGGDGARTAGVLMARTPDGLYFVEDVVKGRWSALERERVIQSTAAADAARYRDRVAIWAEQEPGSGGKESAEATVRGLAGHNVRVERVTGDKVTRALPLVAQAEAGNVRLLRAPWNREFWDEVEGFPLARLKDQIDAAAGAFNKLAKPAYRGFTV